MMKISFSNKEIMKEIPLNFSDFKQMLCTEFKIDSLSLLTLYNITYLDEENECITIDSEEDYIQAIKYNTEIPNFTIQFKIIEKTNQSVTVTMTDIEEQIKSEQIFYKKNFENDETENMKKQIEEQKKRFEEERNQNNKKINEMIKKMEEEKDIKRKLEEEFMEQKKKMTLIETENKKKLLEEKEKYEKQINELHKKKLEDEENNKKLLNKILEIEKKNKEYEKTTNELKNSILLIKQKNVEEEEKQKKNEEENKKKTEEESKKKQEEKKKIEDELLKVKKKNKELEKKLKELIQKDKKDAEKKLNENNKKTEINNNNIKLEENIIIKEKIKELDKENNINQISINNIPNDILDSSLNFKNNLISLQNDFKKDLQNQLINFINSHIVKLKDKMIKDTIEKNNELLTLYMSDIEEKRKIFYQSQNNTNPIFMSVCETIHNGIKCDNINCKMNPIKGIRYKCSICANYNLCEKCENNNQIEKFHDLTHDFIRIRKENHNYSFSIIKDDNDPVYDVKETIKFFLFLKNNGGNDWPDNTFLKANKDKEGLLGEDVKIGKVKKGDTKDIECIIKNTHDLKEKTYYAFYDFFVGDKKYGDTIEKKIIIEDKILEVVKKLKEMDLVQNENPDKDLMNLIIDKKYNLGDIITELFNKK